MNTEQERAALLPCPFCGGEPEIVKRDVEPQGDSWYGKKIEQFVECGCGACLFDELFHEGFYKAEEAIAAWNRRAALQSQDQEGAAQAEWMVDDGRAPWAINSLKDRIKEMRASEKRCRNAFRKDYMRVVSVYFADALGEAAEALERRLSVIDHARRVEGENHGSV